ncbi:nucleotide-binding protein [Gloeophyllum trabeum ATCC 11539]|uniref:Nucleotide-binding protein n=1 Tax=Gloeophyllum trabeum (strain ATCC 11539 / FP-39264 / Madison 617) TaxID=670483 RepID=S7QN33_GLOTA|nr:nucleotide-binding protein [Gloeophyllum trabeum ATCC 11539]EPQ60966.1 nucleotide-binding protein [Gloeophyllum trabeum ATCC 11539]
MYLSVILLSRLSITDYRGNVVLDTYVRPIRAVTDYRTAETGLYPEHLSSGRPFDEIQRDVANIIRDRILVGYCLWDFLSVMGTSHPAIDTRDVALFLPFRQTLRAKKMVPLSTLVDRLMRRNIGTGLEDPLENARAALDLFRSCEDVWEDMIRSGSWPCSLPPSTYARYFT